MTIRDQLFVLITAYRPNNTIAPEFGVKNKGIHLQEDRNHLLEILEDCFSHFSVHDYEQGIICTVEYTRNSLPSSYRIKCSYDTRSVSWAKPFDLRMNIMKMAPQAHCSTELVESTNQHTVEHHLKIR